MCEIPSNAILADQFLEYFDGFSIGSNDMTQLTLGLDRDSGMELLAIDFDERDPAVEFMIERSIDACVKQGKYVGICGQGPSDHPDFAKWLVKKGITSISLKLEINAADKAGETRLIYLFLLDVLLDLKIYFSVYGQGQCPASLRVIE
jgi:phosphoenolpyruvate synthase/pyruvate phosphate dikinase